MSNQAHPEINFTLIPIQTIDDGKVSNEFLEMVAASFRETYNKRGYEFPWIGYYVQYFDLTIGAGGYKGSPVENRIEISYGIVPEFQDKGFGDKVCRLLIDKARTINPSLIITARTLQVYDASTRILEKNGFAKLGSVFDSDDGMVWEWILQ